MNARFYRVLTLFAVSLAPVLLRAATSQLDIISTGHAAGSSLSASGNSTVPLWSQNGRFLLFLSSANNLVPNDANGPVLDIFRYDRVTQQIQLVSVGSAANEGANGHSLLGSVSSEGRLIAFESEASNLVANDTNDSTDVFVRDALAGITTLVSVNRLGTGSGQGKSGRPVMTANGRFIAFESDADDLVAGDDNQLQDVFVRDLESGVTVRASVTNENTSLTAIAGFPDLSDEGRFVAFATTLSATRLGGEVYVRDLQNQKTMWASAEAQNFRLLITTNAEAELRSYNAKITADGRFVFFKTTVPARFGTNALLFRVEVETGQTLLISTNAVGRYDPVEDFSGPVITPDGRWVAFESQHETTLHTVISLWNSETKEIELATPNRDGLPSPTGNCDTPVLSSNGRLLVFLSDATDLVTNQVDGAEFQIYQRDLLQKLTTLVSGNPFGAPGALESGFPAVNSDGTEVAFQSASSDLVSGDRNNRFDVFVRDVASGAIRLISGAMPNAAVIPAFGFSATKASSLSANGLFVVFSSLAENLVEHDTNGLADIFVHDLEERKTALVSVRADGQASGNGASHTFVQTPDGRFVAFYSTAEDLVPGDTNRVEDLFVRDLVTGVTRAASINKDGVPVGVNADTIPGGNQALPGLSDDGRFVVFQSSSKDLAANDSNLVSDIFVHDFQTRTTELVSVAANGTRSGNNFSIQPSISGDGRFVLFSSRATDLTAEAARLFIRDRIEKKTVAVPSHPSAEPYQISSNGKRVVYADFVTTNPSYVGIALYEMETSTRTVLCTNAFHPRFSRDENWVTAELAGIGSSGSRNVFVFHLPTGASYLASVNASGTGPGTGRSGVPVISANGRTVAFESRAADLVWNDDNGQMDIFVRDMAANRTILISRDVASLRSANGFSLNPSLSGDGRIIAFESFASDLVENDFNMASDVFVVRLGLPDTDVDGLDDDWEVAFFNNLARDGTQDADNDGVSDLAEFRAGTSPISDASVFKVTTMTSVVSGEVTVHWDAVPGKAYQVQFKNGLQQTGWENLGGPVSALSSSGSARDATANLQRHRFYRVRLLD
jgi:Tol biopolymer transport system component